MITIDRIPFKYTSANGDEQQFQFAESLVGPTSITIAWQVVSGSYKVSLGEATHADDSPDYAGGESNDKGWATLKAGQSIFAKPAASSAVITFTR